MSADIGATLSVEQGALVLRKLRGLADIQRDVVASWPAIAARARTLDCTVPAAPRLLGTSTKTRKGPRLYDMRVVYLAPDRSAFAPFDPRTLCPFSTRAGDPGVIGIGCSGACLGEHSGQMGNPAPTNARLWRTTLYFGDRRLWRELLDCEIRLHDASCSRRGRVAVIRVDGTSDTSEGRMSAERNPTVQHMDYSKNVGKVVDALASPLANYRVVLSFSGVNEAECVRVLALGGVVAAVVDARPKRCKLGRVLREADPLPDRLLGAPAHSGDDDDLVFLAPPGSVRVLRFKTAERRLPALASAGEFVIRGWDLGSAKLAA